MAAENLSLPELTDAERKALSEGKPLDPKILAELVKYFAPIIPFAYKEHIVLVYIRDQYLSRKNYEAGNYNRFHLCFCRHLRRTQKNNLYESRYVMTYETRGNFLVNLFDVDGTPREQNVYRRLKVCQYCLRELNWKNFRAYCGAGRECWSGGNRTMRRKIVDAFDIAEYLLTVQKNKANFPPVEFTDVSAIKKEYVLSAQIKLALKKNVDYTCEVCRKKFPPADLEIHHKNHNQGDNRRDNLSIVCRECHNKIHAVEGGVFVKRNAQAEYAAALKVLGDIASAENDKAAKNFYRQAAAAYKKLDNDLDAKFELANIFFLLEEITESQKFAEIYLSCAGNSPKELIRCGLIHAKGLAMPTNFAKSWSYFEAIKDNEEFFTDREFIELNEFFRDAYAEKLRAQAIEIFEAASPENVFAIGELVELYRYSENRDVKEFFNDAQKLLTEKISKPPNNFL